MKLIVKYVFFGADVYFSGVISDLDKNVFPLFYLWCHLTAESSCTGVNTLNIPKYKKYISYYGILCLIYLSLYIYLLLLFLKHANSPALVRVKKLIKKKWEYNGSSKYSGQLFTSSILFFSSHIFPKLQASNIQVFWTVMLYC